MNTDEIKFNESIQMALWASGILSFILFFFALIPMMDFIPPPLPAWNGEQFLAEYGHELGMLKAGTIVGMIAGGLLLPWTAMVAIQVQRMEAGRPPVLSVLSILGGSGNAIFTIICFMLWCGAFYRPSPDPAALLVVYDVSWLIFIMMWPPLVCQLLAVGFAGLNSSATVTVLPRWFCFLSLWTALLMTPGSIAVMFYEGPFAWNGLLAFWLVVIAFCIYNIVSFFVFHKAIKGHSQQLSGS